MTQPKDVGERLHALANALADSVAEASDAELLEDARAEGRDPNSTRDQVQKLLREAVQESKKKRITRAEAEHRESVAAIQATKASVPIDPAAQRALLGRVLRQKPDVQLTLQYRDFDQLTGDDILNILRKLQHLGLLDDVE